MSVKPDELPLHLSRIETTQGAWLIAIDSVAGVQSADRLLLKLILEQSIGEERFRTRELGMLVPAPNLHDPDQFGVVLNEIRRWIETTEGDGFLEIGASQDQV